MEPPRTIRPGDGLYPDALSRIADRPAEMRLLGSLGEPVRRVAIVGSRRTDEYGSDVARAIAAGLARAGVSIVSGGALGVDAAAHGGALDAGGHTVAVLGTGIDVCYPSEHRSLFERIVAAGGALLSEQPDGTRGYRSSFPRRNRIVSGLSDAVVVVRAGEGSGALITAGWARSQGVPLLAVPGDVRDPLSAGPLDLLRGGARVAAGPEDVLAVLGIAAAPERQMELPALGAEASALLSALGRRPRHADDVARAARLGPGAALAGLLSLELQGLCERRPGHYFLRRS
ncbi:MAG TPA: DNA-processing protein DprA [Anaeromyxobacteraceae bacterium]|nr:DNA-processing protein DprA [Anaeromyxobacteraceae bacterium]